MNKNITMSGADVSLVRDSNKQKGVIAGLILSLSACGGGGGGSSDQTASNNTPINTVPANSTSYIELGPIAGGTVQFQTLGGNNLSSGGTTRSDGSLDYSPRDIVSKMGNDQWAMVVVSGGSDTDVDDDGVIDVVATPVRGSFRMLVPRSALESGERIVVNPRSGIISELLIAKNTTITAELLDTLARQSGVEDQNNDGVVNYKDTYSIRMKDVTGVSKIVPATSGYIASIHSGDATMKVTALSNITRTENHIIARIVPSQNTLDHTPSLELTTSSPGAQILYTLDLSSPIPGGATTRSITNKLVVPFQNAKLYYREYSTINGQMVLGKVVGFDLTSDWTELAQSSVSANNAGRAIVDIQSLTYKSIPYTVTTLSNSVSSQYTYPKTLSCQVGVKKDAGCHLGPYMAWSPEHEARIRGMIDTAVKTYIDTTPEAPVVPTNLVDFYRNNVSYNGATYTIKNTWTQGPNNTRIFPVVIDITINQKNGQLYTTTRTVGNQADLTYYNTELEKSIKQLIDNDNATPTIPTHTQNQAVSYTTRVNNYYGGFYEVFNTYNLDGKSDFPVQISGIYGVQNQGTKTPTIVMAANETERVQKSNQMVADIQRIIQAGYTGTPPTYPQNYLVPSSFVSYRGYGYQLLTTMNITGSSDYPASVRVSYTTPLSNSNTTLTINANSASELASVQAERINDAKARIDLIVNADQYPPNYVENITSTTSYGGGSYYTKFTYSGNLGQDYPGYVDVYRTFRNGSQDKWTFQVDNSNQKSIVVTQGEAKAREDIDNYNPSYPVNHIGVDGPYPYGNKGSEYTYKVKYNRVGNGANYPALVWIEYKSGSGVGSPLDTRTTYGTTIANSSAEKEQIKATLTAFVKGQMVALAPISPDTMLATNRRLIDLLPLSSAHAQTTSSILVNKTYSQLPNFSPFSSNTAYGKFFAGGTTWDHFVRNENGKGGVAGTSQPEIERKINETIISGLNDYLKFGKDIYLGDISTPMKQAIESTMLDSSKYYGNIQGLINARQATLINAGVPQSIINNIWYTIGNIWATDNSLYDPNSFYIAATIFFAWEYGTIAVTPVVDGGGTVISRVITGPLANGYAYSRVALLGALGIGKLGPEIVKLLPAEQAEIQLLTKTPDLISKLNNAGQIYGKLRDATNRLQWMAKGNIATPTQVGTGLDHIMLEVRAADAMTRFQQMQNSPTLMNWMNTNLGYTLKNPADLQKLWEYIIKNAQRAPQINGTFNYDISIGSNSLVRVVSADNGYTITMQIITK